MTESDLRTTVSPNTREADYRFLRTQCRPKAGAEWPALRVVDLFSGCGGMTLGLWEAARRASLRLDIALAVDSSPNFVRVLASNFPESRAVAADVAALFDGELGTNPSAQESRLKEGIGSLDVLLGGPPCQGHSDLNNHTRRRDPKNALYLRMARAAEVLRPAVVVIENVPPVQWDSSDVVGRAKVALEKVGYQLDGRVVDLARVGVPQTRKRFLLVASRLKKIDPVLFMDVFESRPPAHRDLRWAIGDLETVSVETTFDAPTQMSEDNKRRVAYLFKHRVFDLPNSERPPCHRDNDHSYKSMYGRLRWNEPAQTVTTGFGSMGQGRYVHPSQRRTLTPHEAARLQTFPDWFSFREARGRTELATLIGNAVPPLLMTALGSALLDRERVALLGTQHDETASADEEWGRSVAERRPPNSHGASRRAQLG